LASKDFDHWSPGEFAYAAERTDPPDTDIYSISTFPYGGLYIHLIQMYYAAEGKLDYQAGFSHDGKDIGNRPVKHRGDRECVCRIC